MVNRNAYVGRSYDFCYNDIDYVSGYVGNWFGAGRGDVCYWWLDEARALVGRFGMVRLLGSGLASIEIGDVLGFVVTIIEVLELKPIFQAAGILALVATAIKAFRHSND